jgi:hypothetical protein
MKVRRLIPALAMLLVAAMLLGTSTFAWFTMNDTVTAQSMAIKATTNANLFIEKDANVALENIKHVSVTNLEASANSVKPAEMTNESGTVTVKAAKTYTTAPTVDTAGTAATYDTIGTVTNAAATDAGTFHINEYAVVSFVSIARKQTTAAAYKLTPTCKVTFSQKSDLNKSLRAGLIINGNYYESNDAGVAEGEATFTFTDVTGLQDNTAYSAALLLWFEGEDTDCFVNNAIDLSNNTATWSFKAADAA